MENSFAIIAAVAGSGAFFGAVLSAAFNLFWSRAHRKARHTLELNVNGETITIDVSGIDREDPDKLDRAIKALRDVREMPTAA